MSEHRFPEFSYANPDDEMLPITKCLCGATFKAWEMNVSVYRDDPTTMPCCGRRVYWSQQITLHVLDANSAAASSGEPVDRQWQVYSVTEKGVFADDGHELRLLTGDVVLVSEAEEEIERLRGAVVPDGNKEQK